MTHRITDARRGSTTSTPARNAARLTEAQVAGEVSRIAKSIEWSLGVPGRHYSGLSYDDLLDILEEQGRPFREDTRTLRKAVLAGVQLRLEGLGRAPTWREFREAYAIEVLSFVVKRFEAKVRDVAIRRLTPAYAKRKERDRYGDRPIGTRTGSLVLRVVEHGEVKVTR